MYKLQFLKEAEKEFKSIDSIWQKRIKNKLEILRVNPQVLSANITRLKGKYKNFYRLKVGNYRIIFTKNKNELIILIIRIAHRGSVYK
ncbi:MAG: type II toxin-antitoxin system RelE/ParE family toxin [Candidatus Marinimicrobia bacterium]|nr:type II toxin-antitoxin system RelE/ParE family toxin [Candidatus Neomarinimicrobiota bacterium]